MTDGAETVDVTGALLSLETMLRVLDDEDDEAEVGAVERRRDDRVEAANEGGITKRKYSP
jgi:hypothetical protein